jgi:hypothetical protein
LAFEPVSDPTRVGDGVTPDVDRCLRVARADRSQRPSNDTERQDPPSLRRERRVDEGGGDTSDLPTPVRSRLPERARTPAVAA